MPRRAVFLPPFDALADAAVVAGLAAEAERAGWDALFVWDHVAYTPPVEAIADPWICLAAAAVATERIALGAMVTPLSRRRPVVLARQAVTLDRLTRGRLILGFGLGDDGEAREMSRFGEEADPRRRAEILDEGLTVLTALLAGDEVDHDGPHHVVRGLQLAPRPWRAGGIPIWLAARWPNERPLRRAVRYDGAFVIGVASADELSQLVATASQLRGGLDGFDVVVELPGGVGAADWSLPGVGWLLTRFGPYAMDLEAITAAVRAGP